MRNRDEQPLYPENLAFVIQFQNGTGNGEPQGRVEHMASGRAEKFLNAAQLLDFVARVLHGEEPAERGTDADTPAP